MKALQDLNRTSVTVSSVPSSISVGQTPQCSVTVQGTGNFNAAVDASGLYTASATAGTATAKATSVQDPSKFGTATVTITSASSTITSVKVTPSGVTVQVGQTQQFNPTVTRTGSFNPAVTWLAVDVANLQLGNFRAPHACAVKSHQQGALHEIACRIDELSDLVQTQHRRDAIRLDEGQSVKKAAG